MARWAVTSEPRSPGRSICSPGGGLASPAVALVMVAHHALAPCVKCASTSPTVQPVHALGLDHPSWPRRAMKSQSWEASKLITSFISVIAVVFITSPYAWLHLRVYGLAEALWNITPVVTRRRRASGSRP